MRSLPRPWTKNATLVLAACLLAVGGLLRFMAWPWHNNLWAIDWLSYYEPQAEALATLRLHRWLLSWEGLHPPVSGVVHGTLMALGVPLSIHWAASLAATLGGAAFLALAVAERSSAWLGLAVLGWAVLSPLQANYGLNTSPYPWVLLLVGASVLALARAAEYTPAEARRHFLVAAVLAGLALQTHVLAFAVALGQALWLAIQGRAWLRDRKDAVVRWAVVVGLFTLPMVVGSLTKTSDPWTFHIERGEEHWVRTASMVLHERFGARYFGLALGGLLALLGAIGMLLKPRGLPGMLGLALLGWCSALFLFIELGVADPRLSHYYLVPHLLGLGSGAVGAGTLMARVPEALARRWVVALVLVAVSIPWGLEAVNQQLDRRTAAMRQLDEAREVRTVIGDAFAKADDGDVVAYLWDHQFLNDEPEYLDPFAAWPPGRVGRRCREEHPPRGLCNAAGNVRFYFDPSAFSGHLYEFEEPLRLMVNQAEPPGRARIFLLPSPEAPPRPFASEVWMEAEGGTALMLPRGVTMWEFPPGTRIEPPDRLIDPPEASESE